MIHANELMIGDWVCTEHDSTPRQIDWIRTGEVGLFWNKVVTPPYLVPIPLTPEILEKNGFKRVKYGYGWKEHIGGYMGQITSSTTPIEIMYYDEGHCVVSNPHIGRMFQGSIDGVHELQHCLKLCGINKTIKL